MKNKVLTTVPPYLRYLTSLSLVVVSTYFKIIFFTFIGNQVPFLLYLGLVLVISRRLGKGPAFFALALCMAATNYFFMVPYYSFYIDAREFVQLFFFGLEGYLIIMISDALAKALKKNQADSERFKAILEKSSDGIVVVNTEGKRTYCSPSVKNVIGYSDEEYLHLTPWQLGHPDEIDNVIKQYRVLTGNPGSSMVLLHRMKHKKGHWIWVESRVTNSLNDTRIKAMIANFNDVTQRVEIDQNRKDFIGVVSHELRAPLTSIKAYGQLLVRKLDILNDKTFAALASKIMQNSDHMEKMIADLMDVTLINAGHMQLHISCFDFNALAREIMESLQQTTDKHLLHAELCPLSELSADRGRISQVIINLISNAIKYSPNGGVIVLRSQKNDGSLLVSVKDPGIGIPDRDTGKVFERLYRVGNAKDVKGLGLGLYICQQIVQRHNGAIGVESEEGKGSVFWFTLPL